MDIYNANKSKIHKKPRGKKVGWVVFFVWIVLLTAFILFVISESSGPVINIVAPLTFFGVLLLLPAWGFLLGNRLIKILTVIPIVLFILFILSYIFIFRSHKLIGHSMGPNFVPGEYFLSEKVSYYFNSPKRGDLIVFNPPARVSGGQYFARIIGLPGEYISIKNGHVYINSKILNEPYINSDIVTESGIFISDINTLIPDGSYAVMGDNRTHSSDSRFYGFIKGSSIVGRLFYIYWKPPVFN